MKRLALALALFLPTSALAEDVVVGKDGSQLRGRLVGDVAACRSQEPGASCEVRITGGSILVMRTEDVAEVKRGRKVKDHTGHGGQIGIRANGGGSVSLLVDDAGPTVPIGIPLQGAITWGLTDAMELHVGYRGTPLSTDFSYSTGNVGFRYYLVPLDRIKFYQGGELLIGGIIGLRTTSGYQLDLFRAFGLYIETGFFGGAANGGFTIGWDAAVGTHLRF